MTGSTTPIHRDPFAPGDDPRRHRGRRTGSRAKLAKRFFEDLYASWEEQGEGALARAAFHDPMGYVAVVARLMPQKIEVSTPTDGMSDERLAELLDVAERMARLRAQGVATPLLAHELADENGVTLDQAEAGGGGPLPVSPSRGVNTPNAITAETGRIAETLHNKVCDPIATAETPRCSICATPLQSDGSCPNCSPSGSAPVAELPYPVGRPCPKAEHVVERENRARLAEADIDPASLF